MASLTASAPRLDKPMLPKLAQLVEEARTQLARLGIDTEGKRSDQILTMAREERNKVRPVKSQ